MVKRTALFKRVLSLGLAVILTMGLLPAEAIAVEKSTEEQQSDTRVYAYRDENGNTCYESVPREDGEEVSVFHALTRSSGEKLPAPNLRWETAYKVYTGEVYDEETGGHITMRMKCIPDLFHGMILQIPLESMK